MYRNSWSWYIALYTCCLFTVVRSVEYFNGTCPCLSFWVRNPVFNKQILNQNRKWNEMCTRCGSINCGSCKLVLLVLLLVPSSVEHKRSPYPRCPSENKSSSSHHQKCYINNPLVDFIFIWMHRRIIFFEIWALPFSCSSICLCFLKISIARDLCDSKPSNRNVHEWMGSWRP